MAKRRIVAKKRYSTKSIIREREYGFFWYSWIWRILRPLLIFTCAVVITLGIVTAGWNLIYDNLLKPMDPDDPTTVTVEVPRGASITKIANILHEQDLLRNTGIFRYTIMFQGVTNKIHYGTYQISPNMTINEMIQVLTSGSSSTERTITIIPGWTVEDIAKYLHGIGAIKDEEEFKALCNNKLLFGNYYVVQEAIQEGGVDGRKYLLEGYLAPDTYRIFTNATTEDIIKRLMDQTDLVLNEVYNEDNDDEDTTGFKTTLTRDQTIVLASMIEKEAVKDEDFARVSAVFHNRLSQGMRLESDPTVKYTLGINKMALTSEDTGVNSLYNTYQINGLPIGPICNPSEKALEAALNPDMEYIEENYLFFCSKDPSSGDLQFSKTLEEHNSAVATYRPLWEEYDRQQAAATPTPAPATGATETPDPDATPAG